jgi:putative nucleotidyltransferase with HDIG domain
MTEVKQETSTKPAWFLTSDQAVVFILDQVKANSVTDFALFLIAEGEYVLYAPPKYHWSEAELGRLAREGHGVLYYSSTDQLKVDAYLKIAQVGDIDTNLPPREQILQLTDVAAQLTKILYDYPLTPASLAKGTQIANQLVEVIQQDPTSVTALGKLASHDWYTYYHSARVAAYALAIAIEMGLSDKFQLQELSLGCLFHDIGKSKIDLSILNKTGPLTNDEWAIIRTHPEFGIRLIDNSKISIVPREIILHHHERLDGAGYPHRLTEHELLQEVRIAAFADTFDALTTNRPYQPGRSRFEALDLIRHRFLQQLDPECYKAMVEILKRAGT